MYCDDINRKRGGVRVYTLVLEFRIEVRLIPLPKYRGSVRNFSMPHMLYIEREIEIILSSQGARAVSADFGNRRQRGRARDVCMSHDLYAGGELFIFPQINSTEEPTIVLVNLGNRGGGSSKIFQGFQDIYSGRDRNFPRPVDGNVINGNEKVEGCTRRFWN